MYLWRTFSRASEENMCPFITIYIHENLVWFMKYNYSLRCGMNQTKQKYITCYKLHCIVFWQKISLTAWQDKRSMLGCKLNECFSIAVRVNCYYGNCVRLLLMVTVPQYLRWWRFLNENEIYYKNNWPNGIVHAHVFYWAYLPRWFLVIWP